MLDAASTTIAFTSRPLRFLVVEGNVATDRERHRATFGMTPAQSYAATLRRIRPDAVCAIVQPADADAELPDGVSIAAYDAVFLTGSALHVYDDTAPIRRQIDFAREVYRSRTPFFGSCWGIQIGAVAAGGSVTRNHLGREVGFARAIRLTEAGRAHALMAGRPAVFDAPAIHLDIVSTAPPQSTILAANAIADIHAAEFRHDGGVFCGVQYHPEFSLGEVAAIMGRIAGPLSEERLFADEAAVAAFADDLRTLDRDTTDAERAARWSLDAEVLDFACRTRELSNFIAVFVEDPQANAGLTYDAPGLQKTAHAQAQPR